MKLKFRGYMRSKIIFSVIIVFLFNGFIFENSYSQSHKVVKNPNAKWGENSKIKIKHVRNIGSLDDTDDNFLFYMPSDVIEDGIGNLYVVDTGNHRIQKFDRNLNHIATIGREGQGPGEFKRPNSLVILNDGNLFVSDQGNYRFQTLNPKGKNQTTVNMERGTNDIWLTSDNELVMGKGGYNDNEISVYDMSKSERKAVKMLKKLSLKGKSLDEMVSYIDFNDVMMNQVANIFTFTMDKDDNIFINFSKQNLIQKYSLSGKLLMNISRKLNYGTVGRDGNSNRTNDGQGRVRAMLPQLNDVSSGIAVDENGRIWAITYDRQIKEVNKVNTMVSTIQRNGIKNANISIIGNTELIKTDAFKLEVFDKDGVLLQIIPLTHFADSIRIYGDTIYILDSYRAATFYQYKIVDK